MSKLTDQVIQFHRAMHLPVRHTPAIPNGDRVRLRLRLIAEEFLELLDACGASLTGISRTESAICDAIERVREDTVDLGAVADALADLDYVTEGARLEFGIDGGPIADAVHDANMRKTDGPIREDGKRLKPPGWTPPDILGCLKAQGWEP
jgi:predicted HAD superfamily Cof-like phosphohydrolase